MAENAWTCEGYLVSLENEYMELYVLRVQLGMRGSVKECMELTKLWEVCKTWTYVFESGWR